jgi:hypothetical protein
MRNIATLLNISLLITVAYLMVKFGPPHAGNAWIFTLMVLPGIMEQPPHSSAGLGDAAAPVLSGELIL